MLPYEPLLALGLMCLMAVLMPIRSNAAVDTGVTFTKVTTGELVTTTANYWGGAWGDYDDDGWLDLFIGASHATTRNFLYHNERDGTFTRVDDAAMPKSPSNQHGTTWADYDNDGHLDVMVTAGNPEVTHNVIYRNNGNGTFSWVTNNPIYTETQSSGFHAPAWGDYDNDGFVDLFIAGHGTRNRLFRNQGGGGLFTRLTTHPYVLDPVRNSEGRSFVDYDGDGDVDLFVSNTLIAPFFDFVSSILYRNDGAGVFTRVTDSGLSDFEQETAASCFADYDNDGFPDLFLASGTNALYHNEGNGTFTDVPDSGATGAPVDGGSLNCAWADYDNDGFLDLYVNWGDPFVAFSSRGVLFHNEGDGTFAPVTEGAIFTNRGGFPAWGDYDNDGFVDLLLPSGAFNPVPQFTQLFHNDGNGNAWLNVKLVGTRSNRSAIGAKVRVQASYRGAIRWQLREINGGDAQENQQSLNAEFGLADATMIETVRVEWPSGLVQELHDVAPRQFLTITEPGTRSQCSDGVDNDGDGLYDLADPGCPVSLPGSTSESPQCDDGIDNDGNGLVDFADPKCTRAWPYWEKTPSLSCGLGGEVALLLAPWWWMRRRRSRRGFGEEKKNLPGPTDRPFAMPR